MPELDLSTVTTVDGRRLLAAAQEDWSRPVLTCPGWTEADLVGHMGAILGWMAKIVTTGKAVPRSEREMPPAGTAALAAWYAAHLERTIAILTTTPAESTAWTFSACGDQRVSWWRRRLAVELAIHRWDAEHAVGKAAPPLDGDIAASGIEEFLTEFLPGLLAKPDLQGLTGSIQLHATDGVSDWWVSLEDDGSAVAVAGHRKAETVVRATRSDLLLWLTNRQGPAALEISGLPDIVARWPQLRR